MAFDTITLNGCASEADMGARMKAIVQSGYGSADTLALAEIERPTPRDDEVLLRVRAASMHIGDWHLLTGRPYMLRAIGFGLRGPKTRVRGLDVAGTVEAVGRAVTDLRVGDEVFGACTGAFAECATAKPQELAPKPANLSFEQAAAVATSGCTALQALRDKGELRPGQHVLVIGASGGVGLFAVQIAKALGARVTGVSRTSKVEAVRALGADGVIDYTREDFTRGEERYDVILDMGGGRRLADLRRVLAPRGVLVLVGAEGGGPILGGMGRWLQALALGPFSKQRLRLIAAATKRADLLQLKELIEASKLTPVIDRTYPLSEVADAFRHLESGRALGKIVIEVASA